MSSFTLIVAGFANVILGMIWYNPHVFGGAWMRLSNITPEQAERGAKRRWLSALVGFLAAVFMAWVLSIVEAAFGVYDWIGGIDVGFWIWAGFIAPVLLGSVLWEAKPFKLYLINALYWLVALLAIGVIVSF